MKLFRKLFLVKEIISKTGVLHFQRWRILDLGIIAIYIHKIYEPDQDQHLHNHPWNYFNLILSGGYEVEELLHGCYQVFNTMEPMKFSFRKHNEYHKIKYLHSPTTTLFITGRRKYEWGYFVDGQFVNNEEYRKNKNNGLYA